jgi:similar to stage IV sporulation protein
MFLIRLWHYLKGYVIIIVSGFGAEKFVNICTKRQILIWDMERLDSNRIQMKISMRGFKSARTAARKSRCRVRIKAKKGLPWLLGRYRKRRGFLAGIIAFAILIYFMTSIIWSIEITGNTKAETKKLVEQMNGLGIYRGVSKRFIDPKRLADTLMINNQELSWVGVEIKGTRLHISVQERTEPPKVVDADRPCHIVSARDGIILTIRAKNGLAMAKEGDTVVKGQILVSGNIESIYPEFGTTQVHAMGEVIARTWYEVKIEVPKKRVYRKRTGREWNQYSVYFLDLVIRLPSGKNPYTVVDTSIFDKTLVIADRFRLPLGLTIQRFHEVEEEEVPLSLDEARELARETAWQDINRKIPDGADIVDQQSQLVTEDDKEYIIYTVECTEDIAIEQEIGGD